MSLERPSVVAVDLEASFFAVIQLHSGYISVEPIPWHGQIPRPPENMLSRNCPATWSLTRTLLCAQWPLKAPRFVAVYAVNHQTHHRGQAHMIRTALGKPSLQLDLIAF